MKIVLVLLLSVLLTTCYAVTLKAKARAVLKVLSDNSDGLPSYKSVFKSLLQMAQADEYQQVSDILVNVQQEIQGLLNDAQQKLDNENQAYNSQLDGLNDQVADLDSQLSEAEESLASDETERDALLNQISATQDAITTNQAAVDRETARRQDAAQAYSNQISGLTDAISQCGLAINILNDIDENDLPGGSFLQMKTKRLQKNFEMIEIKLKEIKTSMPAVSFIQSLIKISQSGINADDIESIISLVEDIQNSLVAQLNDATEANANDDQTSQNILANLAASIQTEQELVDNNQNSVNQLIASIDNLNQQIATLDGSIGELNELLNQIGALHTVAVQTYDDLIGRLERDLSALGQALTFLQSQQS